MLVGLLFVDKKKIVKKIVKIKSSYGSIWGRIFLGFEKLSSLGIMWTQFTASVKPLEHHCYMILRCLRNRNKAVLIILRLICDKNICHWMVKLYNFDLLLFEDNRIRMASEETFNKKINTNG